MEDFLSTVVFGGARPQQKLRKKQFDDHFSKKIESLIRAKINPILWICEHDFSNLQMSNL